MENKPNVFAETVSMIVGMGLGIWLGFALIIASVVGLHHTSIAEYLAAADPPASSAAADRVAPAEAYDPRQDWRQGGHRGR